MITVQHCLELQGAVKGAGRVKRDAEELPEWLL